MTIDVRPAEAADVGRLRDLWLALHHHHRRTVDFPIQTDDDLSWAVRSRHYVRALEAAAGFVLVAYEGDYK